MMREAGYIPVELERCPHCRLRPIDKGGPEALRLAARRAEQERPPRLARALQALRRLLRRER